LRIGVGVEAGVSGKKFGDVEDVAGCVGDVDTQLDGSLGVCGGGQEEHGTAKG
jgi:hypothetical protein